MKKRKDTLRDIINKILILFIVFLLFFLLKLSKEESFKEKTSSKVVRIGAGDDISGIILKYLENKTLSFTLESYFIQDC